MSTMPATYSNPSEVSAFSKGAEFMVTQLRLKPVELTELIQKVQALRTVTKTTGVYTSRRIGALLEGLSTEDMVLVGKALQLKPRELPRTPEAKQ